MTHCYLCGTPIGGGGYRRWVQTGTSQRVYFSRHWLAGSTGTSQGLRTLCGVCAAEVDKPGLGDWLFRLGLAIFAGWIIAQVVLYGWSLVQPYALSLRSFLP